MFRPSINTIIDQIIAIHGDDPNEYNEDEFIEIDDLIGIEEFEYEINNNG